MLLAQACRMGGDYSGEEKALDTLLALQPRDLQGLLMRGDCHARAIDKRAATSFYTMALQQAANGPVPPGLIPDLQRAEAFLIEAKGDFGGQLERKLTEAGLGPGHRSARFEEAISLLKGEKQVFLQQPSSYFFPRLPHIQFYEREEFTWLAELEAAAPEIRSELQAIVEEEGAFTPYVEDVPNRPPTRHRMRGDPSWSAFHLWREGALVEENAARCPRTIKALDKVPLPRIKGRSPMALFSLLRPGAHIAPHSGLLNTRLICHLPLIVPPDCRLRVGNETRTWEEGKTLIFDDSIEHEAWNGSAETRVILLFEIWRPEITDDEKRALTTMFEAITEYSS
ncbi:MAG: aspartyl/asparaginyl beta-hydroxylase domain-containing protein [Sphingosinicella sp.]|nr:aspartyl/asparaginyl beta-hydroxylase domain-containing protein [Sphingosinicella sp.]